MSIAPLEAGGQAYLVGRLVRCRVEVRKRDVLRKEQSAPASRQRRRYHTHKKRVLQGVEHRGDCELDHLCPLIPREILDGPSHVPEVPSPPFFRLRRRPPFNREHRNRESGFDAFGGKDGDGRVVERAGRRRAGLAGEDRDGRVLDAEQDQSEGLSRYQRRRTARIRRVTL